MCYSFLLSETIWCHFDHLVKVTKMYFLLLTCILLTANVEAGWYKITVGNCTDFSIMESDSLIQLRNMDKHMYQYLYIWLSNYTITDTNCNYQITLDNNQLVYYIIAAAMSSAILILLVTNCVTYTRLIISKKSRETKRLYRTIV